jgi:uncharacterized protein
LLCNTPLSIVTADQVDDIPPDVKHDADEFRRCPNCQKTYWEGSHTEKMRRKLELWQNLS